MWNEDLSARACSDPCGGNGPSFAVSVFAPSKGPPTDMTKNLEAAISQAGWNGTRRREGRSDGTNPAAGQSTLARSLPVAVSAELLCDPGSAETEVPSSSIWTTSHAAITDGLSDSGREGNPLLLD